MREYEPHDLPIDEHGLTAFQRDDFDRMSRQFVDSARKAALRRASREAEL